MSCLFLVCFFFYIYTVLLFLSLIWNWHDSSLCWRVTPVSHQGGIQTLSISRGNSCIWQVPVRHPNAFQLSVKTPPCLLFIADPRPTSSRPRPHQHCPSAAAPRPRYCSRGFFIPHPSVWLPSCGLHTSKMSHNWLCHRCVSTPPPRVLCLYDVGLFCSVFRPFFLGTESLFVPDGRSAV